MKKTVALLLLVLLVFVSGCQSSSKRITRQSFVFDTLISITAEDKYNKQIDEAVRLCNEYDLVFSRTNPDSELYKINNSKSADLSPALREVLEFSVGFSKKSRGAFDITVEPLVSLWNINSRKKPPAEKEIYKAMENVGCEKISLSPFLLSGATLDLGGVAKGYVADKLSEYFKEANAQDIIIDLGGNVILLGEFTVGIRNPFSPNDVFATITLKDKSAVTSGSYQRYFEYKGERYHHIIDPRTGSPSDSNVASVTVISPSSMQADALSTAIFILGEDALSLCGEYPETDAMIITNDKKVVTTENFKEKYNLHIEK